MIGPESVLRSFVFRIKGVVSSIVLTIEKRELCTLVKLWGKQNVFLPICEKSALYLIVNVFSTKILIGDTILTAPTGQGIAILRGQPSRANLHFSVILRR